MSNPRQGWNKVARKDGCGNKIQSAFVERSGTAAE